MTRISVTPLLLVAPAIVGSVDANPSKVRRSVSAGIRGDCIAVFDEETPKEAVAGLAQSIAVSYGVTRLEVWNDALKGFHCTGLPAYRTSPPETCPEGTWNGPVANAPINFPSVGNSSGAGMVYWDEANGGTCP